MPDTVSDVSGEQVRRNLTENETGIPMTLDIQVVDVKTCQPLRDVAVDIWSCNSTVRLEQLCSHLEAVLSADRPQQGIYSGVWTYYKLPNKGEGYNRSVINSTALRGIQFTDEDGVAAFDSFFPGHYDGRAVHVHG